MFETSASYVVSLAQYFVHCRTSESLIFGNTEHTGPVRALDFNPMQPHLLASGGTNGEVYVWDLKNPGTPYTPGARSSKLDEITALAWNNHVAHVLGTSSSSGYTVVWDLRGKREVTALQYGGGAGTTGGSSVHQGGGVLALGNRRGMSAIAWHPDNVRPSTVMFDISLFRNDFFLGYSRHHCL
jgi:protein transport protein SEC31